MNPQNDTIDFDFLKTMLNNFMHFDDKEVADAYMSAMGFDDGKQWQQEIADMFAASLPHDKYGYIDIEEVEESNEKVAVYLRKSTFYDPLQNMN